jgi:CheY-like chemotaxis protein
VRSLKDNASKKEIKLQEINDYSLILVDIFLEEGSERKVSGLDFIRAFTNFFPHIPAFILSVCDDYEVIADAVKGGADFYILKSDIFSMPFAYFLYLRKLSKVTDFIKKEEFKKSLIGNIRYWNFKRNLLWFGDKCYHMIEHSYQHTKDDWEIANELLYPLLKEGRLKKISDETLYAFLMAIWLHDIGHKGSKKYGEPYQIRDNHGYIGAELIVRYPSLFRICDSDWWYKNCDFTQPETGSLVEVLLERTEKTQKLSILEKIALFTLYHKSNCPITNEEYNKIVDEKKFIPDEYFQYNERKRNNIITLKRIVSNLKEEPDRDLIIPLAFLFRFIDALDIRVTRVGDVTEELMKKTVIENDKIYLYEKLKHEARSISPDPTQELLYVKALANDIIEKIERGESVNFDELKGYLSSPEDFKNYIMLVNHVGFIALQPDHFNLHSAVEKLEIEFIDKFNIRVYLNKTFKELENWAVRERGRTTQTVKDRLVGNKERGTTSYFYSEIRNGWEYLKQLFGEIPEITIIDAQGDKEKSIWL